MGSIAQRVELAGRSPGFLPLAVGDVPLHLELPVPGRDLHLRGGPAVATADERSLDGGRLARFAVAPSGGAAVPASARGTHLPH